MSGSGDTDVPRSGGAAPAEFQGGQGIQDGGHNTQHNQYGGDVQPDRDAYVAQTINIYERGPMPGTPAPAPGDAARRPASAAVTVTIEAALAEDGTIDSRVRAGETVLCERGFPLPREVASVWDALSLPSLAAADRMVDAGRRLAKALLDGRGQQALATALRQVAPGHFAEVVLVADGPALSLPIELIRVADGAGEIGPLGLLPNVSLSRRPTSTGVTGASGPSAPVTTPAPTPGPLKILAAVAAPDETKTLPGQPRHPPAPRRHRPRQHRMATRPVHQPQQDW